jgi:mannitol/fructose-specific phosphotransferase system IIA component (Ntr-type)
MKKQHRSFCNFLQENNIVCGVTESNGKVVLENLISLLKRHYPALDIDYTRKEVESREALFPTMVAPGLAIPHARIPGLGEPLTAIACIPEGCDFGTDDKAKVMVLVLTPVDNPNLHVQLLSALASEFKEDGVTEKVSKLASTILFMHINNKPQN